LAKPAAVKNSTVLQLYGNLFVLSTKDEKSRLKIIKSSLFFTLFSGIPGVMVGSVVDGQTGRPCLLVPPGRR
jgi:hypothetical protein